MRTIISRETLLDTFGARVRTRRQQLGMKQEALADAVGYENHTNIVKIEQGKTLPSFDKAVAIADVLEIPLAMLLPSVAETRLDFPKTQAHLRNSSDEARCAWIALLRAFADDLERHYAS